MRSPGEPLARLKVQAPGPWTLAAGLELTRGERALSDHGAVVDLTASLAEGLRLQLADLGRRFPGVELVLQLDEPSLPAVLAGRIPTPSGFGSYRSPSAQTALDRLSEVVEASDRTVVHCCAPRPPVELFRRAGAVGLSVDLLVEQAEQPLGEAVEAGLVLLLGCLPSTGSTVPTVDRVLAPVRGLWRRLGLDPELLPAAVVLTPSCGLAGATPGYARAALGRATEAARALAEEPL